MRGQLCSRKIDVEATCEVCCDVDIRLEMGGQVWERRLRVSASALRMERHGESLAAALQILR